MEAEMAFQRHFSSVSCKPATVAGPDQACGGVQVCESEEGRGGE